MLNKTRVARVARHMKEMNFHTILVSEPESVYYLTGRSIGPGERMLALLVDENENVTLVSNRLFAQKPEQGLTLVEYDDTDDAVAVLSRCLPDGLDTLGVDKRWPSQFLIRLTDMRPGLKARIGSAPVDDARMVKDEAELSVMRASSRLNDDVLGALLKTLREGDTEREVAARYTRIAKEMGASGNSFSPLICFGPNAAEPHHDSDDTPLRPGDAVICDVGLNYKGGLSDMTRTVFFGKPTDEQAKVYELVRRANAAGKAAVRPGVRLSDVDRAARRVIEEAGYGAYFTHRTGHGIGLSVHEPPDVSASSAAVAKSGMVFSVEPGIYLPGRFGVRIEDLVAVTETGCEVLNRLEIKEY